GFRLPLRERDVAGVDPGIGGEQVRDDVSDIVAVIVQNELGTIAGVVCYGCRTELPTCNSQRVAQPGEGHNLLSAEADVAAGWVLQSADAGRAESGRRHCVIDAAGQATVREYGCLAPVVVAKFQQVLADYGVGAVGRRAVRALAEEVPRLHGLNGLAQPAPD